MANRMCSCSVLGLVLSVLVNACSNAGPESPGAPRPLPNPSRTMFTVHALDAGHAIAVDGSMDDWDGVPLSALVTPASHWPTIRGRRPAAPTLNDATVAVRMAHDEARWFIAVEVTDDVIVSGPPTHPYSGDCVEMVFAGLHTGSSQDLSAIVAAAESRLGIFQLEIPPPRGSEGWDVFPSYRNVPRLREQSEALGFAIRSWASPGGWSAEAVIPFASFDPAVDFRGTLRFNVDYLDYDNDPAAYVAEQDWGFRPDHVFSLDVAELNMHTPRYMGRLLFQ